MDILKKTDKIWSMKKNNARSSYGIFVKAQKERCITRRTLKAHVENTR